MGDFTTGSIIGSAGSLVNGVLGFFGQKSANKANKQMTQMNIDANKEMQQNANDFTEKMWNQNNEYNSPAAQRQRLLDAGINPLSQQMSNTQAQQVSGASGSVGSPLAMQNELGALGNGVADASLRLAQIANINADTRNKNANTGLTASEQKAQDIANEVREASKNLEMSKNKAEFKSLAVKYYNDEAVQEIWRTTLNEEGFSKEVITSQKAAIRSITQGYLNMQENQKLLREMSNETRAKAENYAEQIAVTIMGIKAGVESSRIMAEASKFGSIMQYKGLLARIAADKEINREQLEKSPFGFAIGFLKDVGLYDVFKEKVKEWMASDKGKGTTWLDGLTHPEYFIDQ